MKTTKLNVLIMLLILAAGFSSCAKTDRLIEENELYVKVENASEFSNVAEVKLMMYDASNNRWIELAQSDWKDGGFIIELPETISSNYLHALDINGFLINIATPPTITVSNKNVKVRTPLFCGFDKDGKEVAYFRPSAIDENGNAKDVFFTYVDSDVNISGYTKAEGHAIPACPDCPSWFKQTTTYSIKWKKGWNVWWTSSDYTVAGYTLIETRQWSTAPVSELKWYGSEN